MGSILWLDPTQSRPMAIMSDAGRVSRARCRQVACTAETLDLTHALWPKKYFKPLISPCEHPFHLGPLTVRFHHAGHLLGGALVAIEVQGARVLHAPTFELNGDRDLEPAIPRKADVLLLGSALGDPEIHIPDAATLQESVRDFLNDALIRGEVPLIATDELGVVRELTRFLRSEEMPFRIHPRLHRFLGAYERLGLPSVRGLRGVPAETPGPIVWPLELLEAGQLPAIPHMRTLALTARAATQTGRQELAVDRAIPWTHQPTHGALVEFVRGVDPDQVIVLEGQDEALTQSLIDLGFRARSLRTGRQIPLWPSRGSASK